MNLALLTLALASLDAWATVLGILFLTAFICAIASVVAKENRWPLFLAVLLLSIAGLLQVFPKG